MVLITATKAQLRREAQARRDEIHHTLGAEAAIRFREYGLEALASLTGDTISGFWPIRSEPDLRPLLSALSRVGKQVVLPVVAGPGLSLRFHQWCPDEALVPGPLGTAEPVSDRPERVPDIMLVPLLAFDRQKRRLGYGGGFYDRTIAGLRRTGRPLVTIGVAYAGLEIAEVPTDPWDQSLDAILTERGLVA